MIDQNLLATTILEVGPGKITHQRTGRITVIPNALFVSEPVINESFNNDYILHVFTVPFKREDDWREAQKAFLESANRHCKPYLNEVRKHMKQISVVLLNSPFCLMYSVNVIFKKNEPAYFRSEDAKTRKSVYVTRYQ